ncbi:retinol-binding protein pinta-like [Hyposmocoma kahamanoa]|uniref:retinol-binding protein pinta-like n=1 Tax=Hyposmocoma kahamanoa TaxID=1477025 RepID=UPI000E6D70DF|nr:retinol-binding protein pinta-like [Hyposmocoma kahamanoa]
MTIRPLPSELAEKARNELNEDPKRLKHDLQNLKDWIAKQPHLRARTDDQWLLAFLRGCKFSLERTKEKIDLYYSCRSTAPDFYRIKHTDPKFYEILEMGTILIPPNVKSNAASVSAPQATIVQPGTYDPAKYSIADIISVGHILEKILLMEYDNAIVTGTQTILDLDGVTIGHFLQMTPSVIKKMVVTTQNALPLRVKGNHYLNTPVGFETIFNAIKALLSEKNHNRLYVYNNNYEEMYKYVPKDVLPAEYGGNGGTTKEIIDYWKKKVEEYSSWLEDDEKYGTDESKRPGKPKTAEPSYTPQVAMIRPGTYDPDKFPITDIISVSNVLEKILMLEDDNVIVTGTQSILDLDEVTIPHFMQMTPSVMKKMVVTSQDALPFRVKGIHYLNTPTGFETVFNAIKGLLNKKNQSRLYVHNKNYEEMYKYIPKDILPAEYGGNGGTIKEIVDHWKKKVQEYSSWLEEDEKYGTDESKRPGKPKTAEDMFGLEGSFRQLQVD